MLCQGGSHCGGGVLVRGGGSVVFGSGLFLVLLSLMCLENRLFYWDEL